MGIRTRSILMAAMTVMTAGAVTIAQSVDPAPPPRPSPTVRLVAAVQPIVPTLDPPQAAPTPLAIPIAPNLANTIDNVYNSVEPWVQYGFQLAAAAVAWVPYVGWLSGQILVFYEFGESMVASGVYNFTDWLRGDGGVITNLVDFGVDVGLAFVWLGLDEVAQFVPLPPFCCYPPRPPVQGPFLAAETVEAPAGDDLTTMASFDESAPADEDATEETITEPEPELEPEPEAEPESESEPESEADDQIDPATDGTDENPVDITDAADQEGTGDDTTTTTDVDPDEQSPEQSEVDPDDGQTVDAPTPPANDAPQDNPDEDSAAADE